MRPRILKLVIGAVVAVAVGSVLIGLSSPDGEVDGVEPVNQGPRPTTAAPSSPADQPEAADDPQGSDDAGADLAPASVAGTWAGAPDGTVAADGSTDWCGAVTTAGAGAAERVFGRRAVDAAACAAVSFVLDHRYSRLSLPRRSYAASDFDDALAALAPRTAATVYRPRIARFVAAPTSDTAGEQLGLILFTARSTPAGADHASAGDGHVFYGPAFSTDGYRGRSAWINPRWSPVTIGVDRSGARPRITARLSASAAVPVQATSTGRDDMMTVPTRATFVLDPPADGSADGRWLVSGWTITRGDVSYAALSVR